MCDGLGDHGKGEVASQIVVECTMGKINEENIDKDGILEESILYAQNTLIPSIRYKVFHQGLQDMTAAKLLESFAGKEAVMKIIESEGKVEFNICPPNGEYIIKIREEINKKIKEYTE